MFSLFNFLSIFRGSQLTPFAPMCRRPWQGAVEFRPGVERATVDNPFLTKFLALHGVDVTALLSSMDSLNPRVPV